MSRRRAARSRMMRSTPARVSDRCARSTSSISHFATAAQVWRSLRRSSGSRRHRASSRPISIPSRRPSATSPRARPPPPPIFAPAARAARSAAAGAPAIPVPPKQRLGGGSLAALVATRKAVTVPLLAKDVIVDAYQIYQARTAGADAVLLIAEAIDDALLREMVAITKALGMCALVEAHEATAFGRAVSSGAQVVGVNARNLRNPSEIDVGRIRQLHTFAHADQILVAESGIASVDDARMLPARVDAVLVGTALMRADDPEPLIHGIASIKRAVHV